MKRLIFVVVLLFLFSVNRASASILVIGEQGNLTVNVLSSEDSLALIPQNDYLEVKKAAGEGFLNNAEIKLSRGDGQVAMKILTDSGERDLNVTNVRDNLIEIEAKEKVKRLQIRNEGENFVLEQNGLIAHTSYPIKINSNERHIFIITPTGERYLTLLPLDAAQSALRANIINQINKKDLAILENSEGELAYKINGEKIINVFRIIDYSYPISVEISAQTGEVLSDNTPIWLKILGFVIG